MPDETGFTTSSINLSFKLSRLDPEDTTGVLTAQVYSVPGVNGGRPVSISGLVMALCLARATQMELHIIELMADMEKTNDDLQFLTEVEDAYINGTLINLPSGWVWRMNELGVSISADVDASIKSIESKMDSLNSFSQQVMIDLQSHTNKRDQAYDMLSNILKSLQTTLMAIANNV